MVGTLRLTPPNPHEIRDPIYGFIHLSDVEWALIGTQAFQRLRRIQQLALTHLVYPGATHTRFEHSLGTLHVAGRLAAQLGLSTEETALVRQAALLHDIGHGPFSHVSENLLDYYSGSDHTHEMISAWIVESDREIKQLLGATQCTKIASLLRKEGLRSVSRDIISSRADADKLDYLLRDSYACGVKYGVFDVERLIETAVSLRGAESQLAFDRESVWALEGLILARHHMHRQVYGHRTRLATDAMLVRSMELALASDILPETAFIFKRTQRFLREFLELDDREVQERIMRTTGKAHDMMLRLRQRRLLKRVYQEELEQLQRRAGFDWSVINHMIDRDRFTKLEVAEVESSIANQLKIPKNEVILSLETQENPTFRTPGYETTKEDIMLYDRVARHTIPFFQESDILPGSLRPNRRYLSLYAPGDGLDSRRRQALDRKAMRAVTQAISDLKD